MMVNSRLSVEDRWLCVQRTYLMRQRACTNKQDITGFPFSIHTQDLNLQFETSPRGVPVYCTIRILECP